MKKTFLTIVFLFLATTIFGQDNFVSSITPFFGAELGYNVPLRHPSWGRAISAKGAMGLSLGYRNGMAYFMFAAGPNNVDEGYSTNDFRDFVFMFYSASIGYEFHLPRHSGIRLGVTMDNFRLTYPEEIPCVSWGSNMLAILVNELDMMHEGRHFGLELGVTHRLGDHIKLGVNYSVSNINVIFLKKYEHVWPYIDGLYQNLTLNLIYEFKPIMLNHGI